MRWTDRGRCKKGEVVWSSSWGISICDGGVYRHCPLKFPNRKSHSTSNSIVKLAQSLLQWNLGREMVRVTPCYLLSDKKVKPAVRCNYLFNHNYDYTQLQKKVGMVIAASQYVRHFAKEEVEQTNELKRRVIEENESNDQMETEEDGSCNDAIPLKLPAAPSQRCNPLLEDNVDSHNYLESLQPRNEAY
eukprot:gene9951-2130_t